MSTTLTGGDAILHDIYSESLMQSLYPYYLATVESRLRLEISIKEEPSLTFNYISSSSFHIILLHLTTLQDSLIYKHPVLLCKTRNMMRRSLFDQQGYGQGNTGMSARRHLNFDREF